VPPPVVRMRLLLVAVCLVVASVSGGADADERAEIARAAKFLMKRYDVGSPKGPEHGPDGMWHYPELAEYAKASKRPPGEELAVTASNLMVMMDKDRSSSVSLKELEKFLRRLKRERR
jgi:hypothetical protein